jgi:hypothetical protein
MAAVMLAATAAFAAADEDTNPHLWQPRVRSVAVFKNGLGFFLREGQVALRDGWCVSGQVPPAAFGTLAIFAHDEDRMVDVVGSGQGEVVEFDGADAPDTEAARRARLTSAKDLNVELSYAKGTRTLKAAGKLRSVGPKFVILQSDQNTFAVPLADVERVQILDLPIRVHVAAEKDAKPVKTPTLGMAYLRKGITWIPEYTLKVIDEDTAELTLRGTLVNEAEDLIHCDVNFVVGVPHFVHTKYLAPIAVGQAIRTIGTAVAPAQFRNQMMQRAAIASNLNRSPQVSVVEQPAAGGGKELSKLMGNLPQLGGAAGTDYTVYTKTDLTVRRGERAIVTLFRKRITYSHVYRWSPPQTMKHHLVLHNATDTAWTTGPCLVVDNDRPLSEDLLKYVPRGGAGELPVTTAVNIAHEKTEKETDRKLKAYSPSHNYYVDLVSLKGTLTLKNFEKRNVVIAIALSVPGKPTEASDGGRVSADTKELRLLKRSGTIRWRVELDPDEQAELHYAYERYVPSK